MNINFETNTTVISSKYQEISSLKPKSPSPKADKSADKPKLYADRYESSSITFEAKIYNFKGRIVSSNKETGTLLDSFKTKKDIVGQLENLFRSYVKGSSDEDSELLETAQEDLKSYLTENPEAVEQISNGQVPEYWNKENTARRIFSIALMGFEESTDREKFYERAIKMINQAYGEVHDMLGFDYPQLVLDTKEAALSALEQFRDGANIEDISF